jgi:hypothetical protein
MIRMTTAESREALQKILDLQARNLAAHLSRAEAADQGFVTVHHDLALLERLCGPYRHVVAMDGDRLIGYALVMLKDFAGAIPIIVPLFEQLERLTVGGRRLANQRSLHAHLKVGFQVALQYRSPDDEQWEIVTWDWRPAEAGDRS